MLRSLVASLPRDDKGRCGAGLRREVMEPQITQIDADGGGSGGRGNARRTERPYRTAGAHAETCAPYRTATAGGVR